MKIKKPSLKGMKNCGYLGHFAQDKYMEKGHNLSGKVLISSAARMLDDDSAIRDSSKMDAYDLLKNTGNLSAKEAERMSEIEDRNKRADFESVSYSSDNYGWETTVKNGKRSHRLIRK